MNQRIILTSMLLTFSTLAGEYSKIYFDEIKYQEYLYSKSKKTEVGDNVELDINATYKLSESTKFSLGFQTYPEDNRVNNKTSKFELVASHIYEDFKFSLDGELQTDEQDNGGTNFGVDLDSDKTYISYNIVDSFSASFYPFNFDGEVGDEFNTWDITRINYIEGTPSSITGTITDDEKIATKTIPGIVLTYKISENFKFFYGFGKATYIYPSDLGYDIASSSAITRWERKEVTAHKFAISSRINDVASTKLKYVTQDKTNQTGALIESAASIESKINLSSSLFLESEVVYTKAGSAPWDIDKTTSWFASTAPFEPVYADAAGEKMDFLGKSDFAFAFKLILKNEKNSPYLFARHQGEYFLFRERESAHLLRTADDSKSHGGLIRLGLGALLVRGNFLITPELEYLKARNPVFSSSSDVRDDRILSEFKKTDYLIQLKISYDYDSLNPFSI